MDTRELEEAVRSASELQMANRHDEAMALLDPLVERFPEEMRLRRALALVCGGKAERWLEDADRLGVAPGPEELGRMEDLLARATELDPDLPDPYWDRAVIAARFRGDFEEAEAQLARARELGYSHPMMPRLEALIRERAPAPQPPEPDDLAKLLRELVDQARGPAAGALFAPKGLGDLRTLDEYSEEGVGLVRAGKTDREALLRAFSAARRLGGDAGEIALDFLRRVSAALGDPEVLGLVGNAHLAILAEMSQYFGGQPQVDDRALRKARRSAGRGLEIAEAGEFPVDPDVYGDLLIAMGQTHSRSSHQDLRQAIPLYAQALDRKEAAGNVADAARLRDLLTRMVEHQMGQARAAAAVGIGGIGQAVEALRVAHDAAVRVGSGDLIHESGLALAETLGGASQPDQAIEVLEGLEERGGLDPRQRFGVRFGLAARLSETKRPDAVRRAREIGEEQVRVLGGEDASAAPQTVWMNLGNYRRLDGDLEGARDAFRKALELCPPPAPKEIPLRLGQIRMLLAEAELLLGNREEGRKLLAQAEDVFTHATGVDKLHFESMAARWALELGDPAASALHAARGIGARKFVLSQGPAPSVWESMLREWTRLDVSAVRANHAIGTPEAIEQALLVAEAAKGRLYAWLARVRAGEEAASHALDEKRQEEALAATREWAAPGGRWAVSLFGHREGLSVVGVGPGGRVVGGWLEDFDYDDLRLRVFEPWERGLDAGLEQGDPNARGLAGSVVELLLARVGSWIGRAIPGLADGGEELVLLPHRLFRSLPLAHAELPNGARLSRCFTRVSVSPSLAEFGRALRPPSERPAAGPARAFVDPDATLPFARVEGMASVGGERVTAGADVTVAGLGAALGSPGALLLSCHGDFREDNPWQSTIRAADGDLVLGDLLAKGQRIRSEVVVLGVCEAGKSRRSLSDEPLSFPTLLTTLGASLVIAPAWQVEDFSSFLYVTKLLGEVGSGAHPAAAAAVASQRVRELTASVALEELEGVRSALGEGRWPLGPEVAGGVEQRLQDYEQWLTREVEPNEYPFDALDWAAFQVFGYARSDE